jgi:sugar phosphate isomerase/epimerase
MPRHISLAALTVLELSSPDRVTCAALAGFSHIGMRLLPAKHTELQHDLIGNTPQLREVEQRLADTGVRVLDVEIFRIKPDTRVADYEAAMATAARLRASDLLVAGNDPVESRLTNSFAAFCELASRYGLRANLEFMPWTDAKDLTQAARIVANAQAGAAAGAATVATCNAGVLIDPFHFSRSRSRIEDIAQVPLAHWHYLQFCDVLAAVPPSMEEILAQARAERLFPGEGELDLLGLLRALPSHLPISVEVPTHTLARSMPALARARRARAATQAVLDRL